MTHITETDVMGSISLQEVIIINCGILKSPAVNPHTYNWESLVSQNENLQAKKEYDT
jgi:hypothetical protein